MQTKLTSGCGGKGRSNEFRVVESTGFFGFLTRGRDGLLTAVKACFLRLAGLVLKEEGEFLVNWPLTLATCGGGGCLLLATAG